MKPERDPRFHIPVTIGTQRDAATRKYFFIVYNKVRGIEHQSRPIYDDRRSAKAEARAWADRHWSG